MSLEIEDQTWDAVLALVEHDLMHDDARTVEADLLRRRAASVLTALAPSDLVEFVSSAVSLGLTLGNIPKRRCSNDVLAELVATARIGFLPSSDCEVANTRTGQPIRRRHLEVV